MLSLDTGDLGSVAVLGAHCDDIAIGAGGLLLGLQAPHAPEVRAPQVHALVLTGAGSPREDEERAALDAFCPGATVTVLDLPDGRMPAHWERAKAAVEEFRRGCAPELVLAPHAADAHQDHRLLAELVPTAFRDHLVLGYEILKWESDLRAPPVFVPLTEDIAQRKVELLHKHYPSQHGRTWFDGEAFLGLARIRGVQCGARYAEAFYSTKIAITTGGK